jgi:hypothetical protein
MARVWVPLVSAELNAMPPVCAISGRPPDRILTLAARARAGWTWWLLPLGVVPFLAARHFAPQVTVVVPVAPGPGRRLERLRLACLLTLVEAIALAAAGLIIHRPDVLLAGVAFLGGAALVRALEAACSIRATLDPSARGVLLSGVHPDFRDQFDRLQRAAWAHAASLADARAEPIAREP